MTAPVYFEEPRAPYPNHLLFSHTHDLTMVGAKVNPNGTWSSVWACSQCPDIFVGGHVGPVPPGYCPCGWVQREWPRERCEECKRDLAPVPVAAGGGS